MYYFQIFPLEGADTKRWGKSFPFWLWPKLAHKDFRRVSWVLVIFHVGFFGQKVFSNRCFNMTMTVKILTIMKIITIISCLLPGGRVDLSASASQRLWPRKGFFSRSSNTSRSKSHLLLILRPKESLFCTKVSVSVSLCPCLCLCLQVSSILINCQQCYMSLYDSSAVL